MKDKDGFEIRCEYAKWKIIDAQDNHDYVCTRFESTGYHFCFCDDHCREYKPHLKETEGDDNG